MIYPEICTEWKLSHMARREDIHPSLYMSDSLLSTPKEQEQEAKAFMKEVYPLGWIYNSPPRDIMHVEREELRKAQEIDLLPMFYRQIPSKNFMALQREREQEAKKKAERLKARKEAEEKKNKRAEKAKIKREKENKEKARIKRLGDQSLVRFKVDHYYQESPFDDSGNFPKNYECRDTLMHLIENNPNFDHQVKREDDIVEISWIENQMSGPHGYLFYRHTY